MKIVAFKLLKTLPNIEVGTYLNIHESKNRDKFVYYDWIEIPYYMVLRYKDWFRPVGLDEWKKEMKKKCIKYQIEINNLSDKEAEDLTDKFFDE